MKWKSSDFKMATQKQPAVKQRVFQRKVLHLVLPINWLQNQTSQRKKRLCIAGYRQLFKGEQASFSTTVLHVMKEKTCLSILVKLIVFSSSTFSVLSKVQDQTPHDAFQHFGAKESLTGSSLRKETQKIDPLQTQSWTGPKS